MNKLNLMIKMTLEFDKLIPAFSKEKTYATDYQ